MKGVYGLGLSVAAARVLLPGAPNVPQGCQTIMWGLSFKFEAWP